jgi:hypothetical protein
VFEKPESSLPPEKQEQPDEVVIGIEKNDGNEEFRFQLFSHQRLICL